MADEVSIIRNERTPWKAEPSDVKGRTVASLKCVNAANRHFQGRYPPLHSSPLTATFCPDDEDKVRLKEASTVIQNI